MTYFVGIGHYSRVGKDTLANAIVYSLQEVFPFVTVAKKSFAAKLKALAYQLYGWAGLQPQAFYEVQENEHLRQVKLPVVNLTPVEIWCKLGTDAIREKVYDMTWVDALLRSEHKERVVVIPDVRFPNEANAIKAAGGLLVKVVRPGYGPLNTTADRALIGYDGWDLIVGGSGEMSELRSWGHRIAMWCAGVKGKPEQTAEQRAAALSVESRASQSWDSEN